MYQVSEIRYVREKFRINFRGTPAEKLRDYSSSRYCQTRVMSDIKNYMASLMTTTNKADGLNKYFILMFERSQLSDGGVVCFTGC